MRVMVTGGTGFVGCHSTAQLLHAGHEVRLLVRDPARLEAALGPLDLSPDRVDHVVGDMCDADSVGRALDGCDAVLHSAAVLAVTDHVLAAQALERNAAGARTVLGAAADRGLDPLVYVSSVGAIFDPGLTALTPDAAVSDRRGAYERSKAEGERYARRLQADGAPVVVTYPNMVLGPASPTLGDTFGGLITALKRRVGQCQAGGWSVSDVRDVAAVHAAAMTPGRGPRRYMAGGQLLSFAQLADILQDVTGRPMRGLPVSGRMLRTLGRSMDVVRRVVDFDTVFSLEAMQFATEMVPTDYHRTTEELGVEFRDPTETLMDSVAWLYRAGHISAAMAGRAAGGAPR